MLRRDRVASVRLTAREHEALIALGGASTVLRDALYGLLYPAAVEPPTQRRSPHVQWPDGTVGPTWPPIMTGPGYQEAWRP